MDGGYRWGLIGLIEIGTSIASSIITIAGKGRSALKIGIDNALGMAPDALMLRAKRTSLLANNVANADTPGFKARDIDFQSILNAQTKSGEVQRTHQNHLAVRQPSAQSDVMYRVPLMPSIDGNTVDTQLEQSAFAENSVHFLTTLRILNGRISGMLTAIKGE